MTWKKLCRLAILSFIVLNSFLLHPKPAWACTCFMTEGPSSEFVRSDAIFMGEVVRIIEPIMMPQIYFSISKVYPDFLPPLPNPDILFYRRRVIFDVETSWKSVETTRVTLLTGLGYGDCGYPFQVGKRYVVYGNENEDILQTNICSRTSEITRSTEDIEYLQTFPEIPLQRRLPYIIAICLTSMT
ncbi:MAG: hypothetical protein AAF485_01270, partial [Chloroflexota bacterium]